MEDVCFCYLCPWDHLEKFSIVYRSATHWTSILVLHSSDCHAMGWLPLCEIGSRSYIWCKATKRRITPKYIPCSGKASGCPYPFPFLNLCTWGPKYPIPIACLGQERRKISKSSSNLSCFKKRTIKIIYFKNILKFSRFLSIGSFFP